jgi:hypothetical protein
MELIVTAEWLKEQNACADQVKLFQQTFGESVELTRANLRRAVDVGLDVGWLANHALNDRQYVAYEQAIQPAYEKQAAAIRVMNAKYVAAVAPACAVRDDAIRAADDEQRRVWHVAAEAQAAIDVRRAAEYQARETYRMAIQPFVVACRAAIKQARASFGSACADAIADALGLPNEG